MYNTDVCILYIRQVHIHNIRIYTDYITVAFLI